MRLSETGRHSQGMQVISMAMSSGSERLQTGRVVVLLVRLTLPNYCADHSKELVREVIQARRFWPVVAPHHRFRYRMVSCSARFGHLIPNRYAALTKRTHVIETQCL